MPNETGSSGTRQNHVERLICGRAVDLEVVIGPDRCRIRVKETMKNKRKAYRIGTLGVHTYQEPSLQPFPMINIRTKQIRSQLDTLDLDALARECRVDTGYTKKIRGRDLMLGFLLLHNQREASLEQWAGCIESFSDQPVSKQAAGQRCTPKHVQFFERVAKVALSQQLDGEAQAVSPALKPFERVLVEDSTCVSLHRSLASAYRRAIRRESRRQRPAYNSR